MSLMEAQVPTPTAGAVLADALARAGVKVVFTVPGESVLPILEALPARRIRVVATRHEGAAAFMAEAAAQLSGRLAVCIATRGPGAANMAVGLHTAQADSAPVLAIVGQVRTEVRGREAFQEMDLVRAFEPIVKWAAEARDASEIKPLIERAIATATRGRPGPVLLSIPEDLLDAPLAPEDATAAGTSHPEPHPEPDPTLVRKVLHLLADARRPVILAGAGVLRARSTDALVRFAETLQVPVVAAWRRPDVFPNDHPLYLGMTGLGAPATVRARLEEADALLVLGCRLNEPTTYGYVIPTAETRWAQVDLEPRGGGAARRQPEIAIGADVAAFLRVARRVLARAALDAASFDARVAENAADREAYEAASSPDAEPWEGPGVHPGHTIATLARLLPPEAIVTTDAGDFGTWAARGYRFRRPGTFLGPTSGAMGYGLPAAIAASLARPGRVAVALSGDGGFAMTMAELETAVRERAHVLAIVFDNAGYGTIRRHQAQRGIAEGLATELGSIDFAALATACGALGVTAQSDDEVEAGLRQALEAGRPALLHIQLDRRWTTPEEAERPAEVAEAAVAEPEETTEPEPEPEPAAEPAAEAETAVEPEAQPEPEPELEFEPAAEIEPADGAAESGDEIVEIVEVVETEDVVFEPEAVGDALEPDAADSDGVEPASALESEPADGEPEPEPADETEAETETPA